MALELHTHVMMRLSRWAIWCLWVADLRTVAPGPRKVKSWWHSMITRPRMKIETVVVVDRAPCPVDAIEAGATDVCVQQLPVKLRAAVAASFLSGGTAEEKALELGCDRATYFRRLNRAYVAMLGLMNDYEAGMLRVEARQVSEELRLEAPVDARGVQCGERKPSPKRGIARERA